MAKAKKSVTTEQKQKRKKPKHLYKKGQSGNPKGRPKGSRNKLGEAFLKDFLEVWSDKKKGGKDALKRVQKEDPAAFVRAAVAILPKELNINHDVSEVEQLLEQFDIEELDQLITGITALGLKGSGSKEKAKATTRSKSNSVH